MPVNACAQAARRTKQLDFHMCFLAFLWSSHSFSVSCDYHFPPRYYLSSLPALGIMYLCVCPSVSSLMSSFSFCYVIYYLPICLRERETAADWCVGENWMKPSSLRTETHAGLCSLHCPTQLYGCSFFNAHLHLSGPKC